MVLFRGYTLYIFHGGKSRWISFPKNTILVLFDLPPFARWLQPRRIYYNLLGSSLSIKQECFPLSWHDKDDGLYNDHNVKSCLPLDYTDEEYLLQDKELVIGLSIALGLLGFELLGFLSGVTMFVPLTAMISIACHGSASILLTYFVLDEWDCHLYWWLFTFCSVLPAVTEAVTILRSLFLKN